MVRNKGKQERRIQTLHGVLAVNRSVLKVEGGGNTGEKERNAEIIPLDEYLRISEVPFKMSREMMAETAFCGQHESSFKSAEKMLRKCIPTEITDALIEEVPCYVGREVYEEDTRRAEPIEETLDRIPEKAEEEGIVYIMVDGCAVNTRQKDEKGSTWKENKLGMVFNSEDLRTRKDGIPHDIQKKE
jgi:hypothetical protein